MFKKDFPNPFMKAKETSIIEEVLKNLRPFHCLEWGCGYSTIYFSSIISANFEMDIARTGRENRELKNPSLKGFKWYSIEHDKKWYEKVAGMNKDENVKIIYAAPNHHPWTDRGKDGAFSDLKNYVAAPSGLGFFDFILIDGRARIHCMKKARELLNPEGVVVLHDANRKYYRGSFDIFPDYILFNDWRFYAGGIFIGSTGRNVHELIDLKKHRKNWRITVKK